MLKSFTVKVWTRRPYDQWVPNNLNAYLMTDGERQDFGTFEKPYEAREFCQAHAQTPLSWRPSGRGVWEASSPKGLYRIGSRTD